MDGAKGWGVVDTSGNLFEFRALVHGAQYREQPLVAWEDTPLTHLLCDSLLSPPLSASSLWGHSDYTAERAFAL